MRHAGLITACLLALDASMAWARVAAPQHVLLAADSPVSDVWPTAHMPIALTDTPATRLFLQADFFNFVAQASVAVLKQLEGTRLPDVRTDTPVPVIGAVHLTLSAMEIHRVEASPADAHMSVTDDRRFDLRIANVTIGFRGKWRWVKGVLNSGGTFEVRAVSSSIAAGVTLQANETTVFPNVRVLDARVSFGELRVVVSDSSLKWLYDVLKGVFSGAIRDVAQAELGKALRETLPAEANRYVAQLPQSIALWKGTHVRYGVVGEPEISARGLVLGDAFGVEVHAKDGSVSGCPLVPATPRTPDPFTNDKMVQLHVRDDVFSCVMW